MNKIQKTKTAMKIDDLDLDEDDSALIQKRPRLTSEQLALGVNWLRSYCSTDGCHYNGADVLEDFVFSKALRDVYPRFRDPENHRFPPTYYLICLFEIIHNHDELPFDVSWVRATSVVKVKPLRKYKLDSIEWRFNYGLQSVVLYPRDKPKERRELTIEDRLDRLEAGFSSDRLERLERLILEWMDKEREGV